MGNELQVMRLNIAICDDEKAIRKQINELIEKEKAGICPDLYKTGDALLAADRKFDIVFLDIQMGGTDGIAVLVRLLMIAVTDGVPVLLYDRHPALYIIIPMIALVLLGAIVFSFRIYQNMAALQEERAEKIVLENQITQMLCSKIWQ